MKEKSESVGKRNTLSLFVVSFFIPFLLWQIDIHHNLGLSVYLILLQSLTKSELFVFVADKNVKTNTLTIID